MNEHWLRFNHLQIGTQKNFSSLKATAALSPYRGFALRKLIQMNQAGALLDLAVPPGNRLKALKGRLKGYHSIRINDQWRIIFRWTDSGPEKVAIVDYH